MYVDEEVKPSRDKKLSRDFRAEFIRIVRYVDYVIDFLSLFGNHVLDLCSCLLEESVCLSPG